MLTCWSLGMSQGGAVHLPIELLIVSCGIRPRDELAKDCDLELGEKGGVKVEPLYLKMVFDRVLGLKSD